MSNSLKNSCKWFRISRRFTSIENHIKKIEDQGENQVVALKDLKPKGGKNNQSIATNIVNDLINKRKKVMNELCESFDKNRFFFEYVGPINGVSFMNIIIPKNFLVIKK